MITMTWYNTVAVVVYILLLFWAKNIYDRPWRDYDVDGLLLSISWINVTLVFTLLWGGLFWWEI
jgi:hypothetical protein